jgi:ATP-dependent protease ClpP protease subunit
MDMSNAYGKILEKMKNYILENTEISKNTYTRMKDKEWTITSDEFVKFGIADEILTDIDIVLQ